MSVAERAVILKPVPLTASRFEPFGDVIESSRDAFIAMNDARFQRYEDLCDVDCGPDSRAAVSIARCRTPTRLPLRVDKLERHPHGSQAFVPLQSCETVIVVAPPGESVELEELRAFVTRPRQGFNYRRGIWHMPLIAFESGQEFLVIDRAGGDGNHEELVLDEVVTLEAV